MEFSVAKAKVFKALLLSLAMTSTAVLMLAIYRDALPGIIIGVAGMLLFGTASIVQISKLFDSAPQVIINSEGIEDKRLNTGLIEWNEINSVSLAQIGSVKWLEIDLRTPVKYHQKLPKFQLFLRAANGQTGKNNLRIRFNDLDQPIELAWEFIENNILKPGEKSLHLAP